MWHRCSGGGVKDGCGTGKGSKGDLFEASLTVGDEAAGEVW